MLLVIDEEGSVRVVASPQALERHRFVERIELFDRLWPIELPDLETWRHVLEGGTSGVSPDEHARVAVLAADTADGDIGGDPEEIRALVAPFERRAVEIANWLFQQRRAAIVIEVELAADDVDLVDVLQRNTALRLDLPQHQPFVVEALGAEQGHGQDDRIDLGRPPVERPLLHRPQSLDLARSADESDARFRGQVIFLEIEVPQCQRLVVEAAGAGDDVLSRLSEVRHAFPQLALARLRHQRAIDLPTLKQLDQQRRDHAAVLHAGERRADARREALPRRLQIVTAPSVTLSVAISIRRSRVIPRHEESRLNVGGVRATRF